MKLLEYQLIHFVSLPINVGMKCSLDLTRNIFKVRVCLKHHHHHHPNNSNSAKKIKKK